MDTLRDKVTVITGAASGIGRAVARAPAGRGAHLVPVDIDDDGLHILAGELEHQGAEVLACRADVSQPDAFDGVRGAALQRFGRVDIVVNNVALLTNGLPEDIPFSACVVDELRRRVADWDAYIDYQIAREPR